jgi:hypothetical protein
VLMDRSRSMDQRMMPSDWRTMDPITRTQQAWHRGPQKSKTAASFCLGSSMSVPTIASRSCSSAADRCWSCRSLSATASCKQESRRRAIGVGLNETNVGRALIAAIAEFDRRPYTGSRIILLVSDGGAHLDEPTQARIAEGLARNRIALYWLYLRSINSPALDVEDARADVAPEIALHRFFQELRTPYRAYQAEVPEDFERAVAEVGKQQNLPLDYHEQIPRQDYSRYFLMLAAFSCAVLVAYRMLQLRRWT